MAAPTFCSLMSSMDLHEPLTHLKAAGRLLPQVSCRRLDAGIVEQHMQRPAALAVLLSHGADGPGWGGGGEDV